MGNVQCGSKNILGIKIKVTRRREGWREVQGVKDESQGTPDVLQGVTTKSKRSYRMLQKVHGLAFGDT